MRALLYVIAALLAAAGLVLGYIAVIAVRRREGVFLPAGYVAAACLAGAWFMFDAAGRP